MHHINLDTLTLAKGEHASPEDGACLMEAAALFADEPFSDHPQCVSPLLGALVPVLLFACLGAILLRRV